MERFKENKYVVLKSKDLDKENYKPDEEAKYFVLRVDTDLLARKAVQEYIRGLITTGEPLFAEELTDWLNSIPHPDDPPKVTTRGICPVCGSEDHQVIKKHGNVSGKELVISQDIICTSCGVVRKF